MDYLQIIGYVASVIIALSMTLNSIVKFRWVNLTGALILTLYAILINAVPIVVLDGFIAGVDIYYLIKIYNKKELFTTLEVRGSNKYLLNFLKFYDKEIQKFFPGFKYKPELNTVSFFILRNMAVAGIFLAHKEGSSELRVGLDFVIPQYRDYKNAKFVFHRLNKKFTDDGIKNIIVLPQTYDHIKYLKRVGFIKNDEGLFVKNIVN